MSRPVLCSGGVPAWLLSEDDSRHEILASSADRTILYKGASADSARTCIPSSGTEGLHISWPNPPLILSDVPFDGSIRCWADACELCDLLSGAVSHHYIVCGQRIRDFALALSNLVHRSAPITPVLVYGTTVIAGPTFEPPQTPCPSCWVRRLTFALPSLRTRIDRGHRLLQTESAIREAFCIARKLWEAPFPARARDRILALDLLKGTWHYERLIPLERCSCTGKSMVGVPEDLVGGFAGSILAVEEASSGDDALPVDTAIASNSARTATGSAAGLDPYFRRIRSITEAAERLASAQASALAFVCPAAELDGALPIDQWLPFTDEQYATEGFAYRRLNERDPVSWIRGFDIATGAPTCVPLRLVSSDPRCAEPPFAPSSSTGIAAARSQGVATRTAFLELVERDIVMRSWATGRLIPLSADEWASGDRDELHDKGFDLKLWACDTDLPAPVCVAWLGRASIGGAFGTACALHLGDAVLHAIEEAALMYSHRRARGILGTCTTNEQPSGPTEAIHTWADMERLLDHYRPLAVDLTTRSARLAGLRVVGTWAASAVDFARPHQPLPLRNWGSLSREAEQILAHPFPFVDG